MKFKFYSVKSYTFWVGCLDFLSAAYNFPGKNWKDSLLMTNEYYTVVHGYMFIPKVAMILDEQI